MARIITPNLNFLSTNPPELLKRELSLPLMNMDDLNARVAAGGWGGMELHDTRLRSSRELRNAGGPTLARLGAFVVSMYESWRQPDQKYVMNPSTRQNLRQKTVRRLDIGSRLLVPDGATSLDHLEKLERELGKGKRLPYVLYAAPTGLRRDDLAKMQRFPTGRIQPTADLLRLWDIVSPQGLRDALLTRGYGVEWGNFAGDRESKISDDRMRQEDHLPVLLAAGMVGGVSVSGSRPDFAKTDPERYTVSRQEAAALLGHRPEGFRGLPLGDMFAMLRDHQWEGDVTVRFPQSTLAPYVGALTMERIAEAHRAINTVVAGQLPHIRFQSLPALNSNK